jgi:hypothetical protein
MQTLKINIVIFNLMSSTSTCFEPEGSSSGRQLYIELWYCTFNMRQNRQCVSIQHALLPTRVLIPMHVKSSWRWSLGLETCRRHHKIKILIQKLYILLVYVVQVCDGIISRFAKLRTTTFRFVMPAHPSVHIEQFDFNWTDIHEIRRLSILKKCVDKIQVSLKSDKNNR